MKQLKDFFKGLRVKSILDVGTGSGHFIKVLNEVFPQALITGIDPDTASLESASKKFTDAIFREMSAEKLDFPNASFDLASISMALHHLPNIDVSLKEMQRVTKPGGWIIVNELFSDNLNPAQEVHKMYHHFRSSIDRIHGISHNEAFRKDEIIDMIKWSGLKIQFQFEVVEKANLITDTEDIEIRVEKMNEMLKTIDGRSEFEMLAPKIEEFRELALKNGFQPATRIVAVGKTN